jgi:hypothetical protein
VRVGEAKSGDSDMEKKGIENARLYGGARSVPRAASSGPGAGQLGSLAHSEVLVASTGQGMRGAEGLNGEKLSIGRMAPCLRDVGANEKLVPRTEDSILFRAMAFAVLANRRQCQYTYPRVDSM